MNVPEIRFKGFEGEWNTSEIGKISNSFSGGTPTASCPEYYGGKIPFIRSGEIHNTTTELFITEKGLRSSSAKVIDKGTILYAMYGATSGEVDISKIKGAINQAILAIIPNEEMDAYYLNFYLQWKKQYIINTFLQGGQGNLSGAIIKHLEIHYPEKVKQTILSNYFQNIENLIKLSISNISSLQQTKAACLQSMFPKEGETVPKVRFKEFEGEWEEKRLNECIEISSEKNTENSYGIEDVLSVSDEFGVQNQIELLGRSFAGKSLLNYSVLHKGQIVYTKSPLKSKPYGIVKENNYNTGIVSVLYGVYSSKEECSVSYLHYYFDPAWRLNAYVRPLVNKGAKNTMNISDATFLEGTVLIPSLAEQQKIASFFQTLDKKISLETQRLEKLKQIKSACLDKMFV